MSIAQDLGCAYQGLAAGPFGQDLVELHELFVAEARLEALLLGEAAQADGGLGLFQPYTIKAGTYPNQTEDVQTIAQPNFLAVSADLADEDVYMITRTIFENLDYLGGIHRAMKALSEENALVGLPVPLHPGAQRYFEEIGLDIPAHLTTR